MKAKEIFVLFLIIVGGVFFYHAHTGKIHIEIDDYCWFISLDEFTSEESQEIQPPFPALLEIDNAHGYIQVQGTDQEKISIFFQKRIWRKNEEQAKEVSDKLGMIIKKDANQLIISTNRDEFRRRHFETNFRISVPLGMDIKVKNSYGLVRASRVGNANIYNRHGEIIASGIGGELIIINSYEDVEVEDVQLDCRIESKHSDVFVNNVKGETRIDHRYGKIHLENISQKAEIWGSHTEVFGQNLMGSAEIESSYEKITLFDVGPTIIRGSHSDVEVNGARENLEIKDKYSKVKLNDIQGNLLVEGRNLTVNGKMIVGDEISISSSYRDIELVEFSGKTTIILSHGKAVLEPSPLTHAIEVQGNYTDIKFFWPLGGKYPFEAQTKGGDIKWELPVELSFQQENGLSIAKAFLQETENPSIFLSTRYGTIRIEQ